MGIDVLIEEPKFAQYPRNEVEIQLRGNEKRRLYVNNEAISRSTETLEVIGKATNEYLSEHDDAVRATIFRVNGPDERFVQSQLP